MSYYDYRHYYCCGCVLQIGSIDVVHLGVHGWLGLLQ